MGRKYFQKGNYDTAEEWYSAALDLAPADAVLYSNRSAVHAKMGAWQKALEDGRWAVTLHPKWAKAHARCAIALDGMADVEGAICAYEEALRIEPTNAEFQSALRRLRPIEPMLDSKSVSSTLTRIVARTGRNALCTAQAFVLYATYPTWYRQVRKPLEQLAWRASPALARYNLMERRFDRWMDRRIEAVTAAMNRNDAVGSLLRLSCASALGAGLINAAVMVSKLLESARGSGAKALQNVV